ncbi:MAG TPA: TlpA family protein disulfide reductase [Porphyromonadaceae bacterium]|jgi:thiol-disulfide isomerase/thioredoxin|nr:TlpA family protein disulfide reductase [Porphyromonadaceae bacterium]
MKSTKLLIFTTLIFGIYSCSEQNSTVNLQSGTWLGELEVAEGKQVPFLFDFSNTTTDSSTVTLINGEERFELKGAAFSNDTLVIPIVAYDAVIKGKVTNNKIEGKFIKNYIENDHGVPFKATYGIKNRFEPVDQPTSQQIDGKWDVLFLSEQGDTTRNVGIFKTDNNIVTGSILTLSGDLRYLEGAYTENGVQLSAFSGLSPYYINLNFTSNSSFEGIFYTTRGTTHLLGTKNDDAALADPYSLAGLKEGYKTLSFELPDLNGNMVSLKDEKYQGKVVIVSILGSWCPNCLDEMAFLAPWYEENRDRGVEIIGIAFERKDDFEYARRTLTQLKERFKTDYPLLFGGAVGRENVAGALPELENFSSYPTTLFIDKQGKVRKVHTGFNGPATGLFYEEFKKDFNQLIDSLIEE